MSFGILQPHLKYRFQVTFLDKAGMKFSFSDDIARQIVNVSPIAQSKNAACATLFDIEIEEDVNNGALKGMNKLFNLESFIVMIEVLDGSGKTLKTTTIKDVSVYEILHSDLDYSGTGHQETVLELKIPALLGDAIDHMRQHDPGIDAMFTILSNSKFSLVKDTGVSSTLRTSVTFEFDGPVVIS